MQLKRIYLIDLPTFPKGVISLSFPAIAACLNNRYSVSLIDMNIEALNKKTISDITKRGCLFVGLKVSCQNYLLAIESTKRLKEKNKNLKIIWGGEFSTLLPVEATKYADAVVVGTFEGIADDLISDLESNRLKKTYRGQTKSDYHVFKTPDYSIFKHTSLYSHVIGFPVETSRGCDKKCTFCMVHTMQANSHLKKISQLKNELNLLSGKFVNVVDYNLGVNIEHLKRVAKTFADSEVLGWMGEMCLETLDNDELLSELAKSRCRIIYCGLESVEYQSLQSVNKARTNNISNYKRIIKKAQKHGIQIGAGIIIGLSGSSQESIASTFRFYQDIGVIYAKLTFLTYNPGTKVHESMKRVGRYLHDELNYFDGNHFTFLPNEVNHHEVIAAVKENIKKFYSLHEIKKRAINAGAKEYVFDEFVQFNIEYREVYLNWIKYGIFEDESGFEKLLRRRYKKRKALVANEKAIIHTRKRRYKHIS